MMNYDEIWWTMMEKMKYDEHDEIWWDMIKYDELWWNMMKHDETWWTKIKYDEIWWKKWNMMKYDEIWSNMIKYDQMPKQSKNDEGCHNATLRQQQKELAQLNSTMPKP